MLKSDQDELSRKAAKRIIAVVTAGMLLLLFDLFIGFDFADLALHRGDDGVYLMRPEEGRQAGHINIKADIETDDGTLSKEYSISIYPYSKAGTGKSGDAGSDPENAGAMSQKELLAYEMRSVINSLNDDQSARRVVLPDHLSTGEQVTWRAVKKSNTAVIAFGMIAMVILIYRGRLDPLRKIQRQQMASVTRQLPEFVNRLVLLLGAGMVLSSAFEHIVEESQKTASLAGDYFYGCMADIYSKVKETNGSMDKEFRAFARSSENSGEGSRQLMRISNILSDNISKGVELTEKLQSESEALWLARKADSEERGRLAETKLTMPLTVFLLVLVVVTVSPALLEL